MNSKEVDSDLQVTCAFLPGRIAGSHIQTIARFVLGVASSIATKCQLMKNSAPALTKALGDTWTNNRTHGFDPVDSRLVLGI